MLVNTDQIKQDLFGWYKYEPEVGDVIERWHPFTLFIDRYNGWEGVEEERRWRPGAWDGRSSYEGDYIGYHERGICRLDVHAVAKPKGFPRRIMYTRQFETPEGRNYKRSGLICHSIGKFRKVCADPKRLAKIEDYEPISEVRSL